MAEVTITKPLMILATPTDQALIMRGLSELPAKETRGLLNRIEALICQNEQPPIQQSAGEAAKLKPVSAVGDVAPDVSASQHVNGSADA
jgi:hypothetical protein